MIKSYRDLRIWQTSIGLVKEVYDLTSNFPKEEVFCLVAQMRRAAISIPSNIAEGFRRNYRKEYKQFLHIALRSCAELETQVRLPFVPLTDYPLLIPINQDQDRGDRHRLLRRLHRFLSATRLVIGVIFWKSV